MSKWSAWRNMRWKSPPLFWVHGDISTTRNHRVKVDLLPCWYLQQTDWTNLSKNLWDNGMFDEPFPQKVCQIILYKYIIQEEESICILICWSLMKSAILEYWLCLYLLMTDLTLIVLRGARCPSDAHSIL